MAKFRTRARTVDMLGRQQIAGVPTAINELFKNAYDAYATHIEVDFYRPENLLVLRDDGLGMTIEDVEDRWLVLGTESKLTDTSGLDKIATELGLQKRNLTGEKGIGRLAIAAIGPQVLLVSRARRVDGIRPTVISFVNWSMFALPGIALDDIEVPVFELSENELPDAEDLQTMVEIVSENLQALRNHIEVNRFIEIDDQLSCARFDVKQLQERFDRSSLMGPTTGTQFYIQPVDPMLEDALDVRRERRRAGDLQKMLMGFTNTMMPGYDDPPVVAEFRDHKSPGVSDSVIGPREFFTPEDFQAADHHFQGRFDEHGQFRGTVAIYGQEPEDHSIVWSEARGRRTECGPFDIAFAYVQGVARESRIPREEWGRLIGKLDSMGGLYIYRNGIRVLPYGNIDYDYLHLEERRNLSAGYYFFSYRRMFGVVDLPPDSSTKLIEKAGREGFRENRAYRQFRSILENFFIQLAADFFREEATRGDQYRQTKDYLDRQARARLRESQRSSARRKELAAEIERLATRISEGEPKIVAESVICQLSRGIESAEAMTDKDRQIQVILEAHDRAIEQISKLKEDFKIVPPRGVGLPSALRRDVNIYRDEYARLEQEVFSPTVKQIEDAVSRGTRHFDVELARRRRFDAGTAAAWKSAKSLITAQERDSRASLESVTDKVRDAIRDAMVDFESSLNDISQRLQRIDLTALSDGEFVQLRLDLDSEVEALASEKKELLEAISQQLQAVAVTPDQSGELVTSLDAAEAMQEDLLGLQERAEADLELTQLGMAVGIIDHEFQSTVHSLRKNLQRLKAWADANDQLSEVYDGLRVNFEHLDGYLTLFTPLHRRMHRTRILIKGSAIGKFLLDLFEDRLNRHNIQLRITRRFRRHRIRGYPSTFYPVFVNLVDNAIFWLKDQEGDRMIRVDAGDDRMIVADTGPGIDSRDREAIFEMGFSRKPGGRGLGLYISQQVLNRQGYELFLHDKPIARFQTIFVIQPKDEDDG